MMKRILLILFVACIISACKKTGVTPGLFGKWELRCEVGGIAGIDSTFKPGNGTVLQFNSDSTYKQFINNKLNAQGVFHIVKLVYGGSVSSGIVFDNSGNPESFDFEGTKITIGTNYDDGIASGYQKISN
jgi:hypothetical protein